MKSKDLRKLTKSKLVERLDKVRAEVLEMAFDIKTGEEKDYSQLKKKKREIARILTLLNDESVVNVEVKDESKKEEKETKKEETKKEASKTKTTKTITTKKTDK